MSLSDLSQFILSTPGLAEALSEVSALLRRIFPGAVLISTLEGQKPNQRVLMAIYPQAGSDSPDENQLALYDHLEAEWHPSRAASLRLYIHLSLRYARGDHGNSLTH